jgi:hypothetical protein
MRIGAVFPQTSIEPDAGDLRAFGTGVEGLRFAHILMTPGRPERPATAAGSLGAS